MNTSDRVFFVDHTLVNSKGHYLSYAQAVRSEALSLGMECQVLAHRDADNEVMTSLQARAGLRVNQHGFLWKSLVLLFKRAALERSDDKTSSRPATQRLNSDWLHPLRQFGKSILHETDLFWANEVYFNDLIKLLTQPLTKNDQIFCPTIDHRQLLAWARWAGRRSISDQPRIILLLRYNYLNPDRPESGFPSWIRNAFSKFERLASGSRIELVTDSQQLKLEYEQLTSYPVKVLPIPHIPIDSARSTESPPPAGGTLTSEVHFIFLGDARAEKGFDILAMAILRLFENGQSVGMRFSVQCYTSDTQHDDMRPWITKLRELGHSSIRLIDRPISREDYQELLFSGNVTLLPYRKQTYYARTSGPLVESIAAGIPLIVTDETWLSEQARKTGTGITVTDGSIDQLCCALMQMRDQYAAWSARAIAAAPEWRAFHNPQNFLEMLLSE